MENEQVETMKAPQVPSGVKPVEMTKNLFTLSKSEGPGGPTSGVMGSFIGMGIMSRNSVLELDSC